MMSCIVQSFIRRVLTIRVLEIVQVGLHWHRGSPCFARHVKAPSYRETPRREGAKRHLHLRHFYLLPSFFFCPFSRLEPLENEDADRVTVCSRLVIKGPSRELHDVVSVFVSADNCSCKWKRGFFLSLFVAPFFLT